MSQPQFFEKSFQQLDQIISSVEQSMPQKQNANKKQQQQKKQSNNKKNKGSAKVNYSSSDEIARFQKTNIQVARIAEIAPLENSNKLFLIKLDTKEGDKQIVGGLQEYYKVEELKDRLVCSILNLKPAKLAGVKSEAMILAGSAEVDGKMQVRVLEPPQGSQIGDRVFIMADESKPAEENILPSADRVNEKQWKKAVASLAVKGSKATYEGLVMRTLKGDVGCNLPDGSEIH